MPNLLAHTSPRTPCYFAMPSVSLGVAPKGSMELLPSSTGAGGWRRMWCASLYKRTHEAVSMKSRLGCISLPTFEQFALAATLHLRSRYNIVNYLLLQSATNLPRKTLLYTPSYSNGEQQCLLRGNTTETLRKSIILDWHLIPSLPGPANTKRVIDAMRKRYAAPGTPTHVSTAPLCSK